MAGLPEIQWAIAICERDAVEQRHRLQAAPGCDVRCSVFDEAGPLKTKGEKGRRGKRVKGKFHYSPSSRSPVPLFPLYPIPLFPCRSLVLLDVVSVNPRAVFLLVARLKENILTVLASHQVHTRIHVLI